MAEQVLVAVPYPVVGVPGIDLMWGAVCPVHPKHADANTPTDATREGAEDFAFACACAHAEHFGVTVVHVVSAAEIITECDTYQVAVCGADLGPRGDVPPCHPVGKYLWAGSPLWATVTCVGCLIRCGRNNTSE